MSNERFMAMVRAWREQSPNLQETYIAAIPQQVADSMAFEGDRVALSFLEENLARV